MAWNESHSSGRDDPPLCPTCSAGDQQRRIIEQSQPSCRSSHESVIQETLYKKRKFADTDITCAN
eukprot:4619781-Karenia_brevis.AAC.1